MHDLRNLSHKEEIQLIEAMVIFLMSVFQFKPFVSYSDFYQLLYLRLVKWIIA